MAEVQVTIKAGSGYVDPWIVIRGFDKPEIRDGEDVTVTAAQDVSEALEELRTMGAFSAVKLISDEFASAPAAGVDSVRAAMPGATEVPDAQQAAPSAPPPSQSPPACTTCGGETKPKSGTGRKGPYKGYACQADRTHFDFIND